MAETTALEFIQQFREHKELTKRQLDKLNETYLHEHVYITISSPDTCCRMKTAGVITKINDTLGNDYRFTIVTENGREIVIRQEPGSCRGIVQGVPVDIKLEMR